MFRQARIFASADGKANPLPVLVLGETGTGKEVVAQLLHFLSRRRDEPIVAVNCAAIPETLLESELFGAVKGAFTGASDRKGLFETAAGGTLFLDEIGEMTPPLQAKLLRVLQDGQFRRVGDGRERVAKARIVAATNREITDLVRRGKFREDLFYRLSMLSITLPPLKGRTVDIELLINTFLIKYLSLAPGVEDVAIGPLREILSVQSYPGNVRELEGIVMKSLILASAARDRCLTADHARQALAERIGAAEGQATLIENARDAMAKLADRALEDILSGVREPVSLPELEAEFGTLNLAYQLTLALERHFKRQGLNRKGPTDDDARAWFGYSGASSFRRWVWAAKKSYSELTPDKTTVE